MINFQKILLFIFIFTNFLIKSDYLPEPYNSITVLPSDWHGWFSPKNEAMLGKFIQEKKIEIIVEVGSWLGVSAVFMASKLPEHGKLYAVDHWLGSREHHEEAEYAVKLKNLYQQFLSNVICANVVHKIIPIRMNSLEAAAALNIKADLIYIDGSHEEQDVYNDIMAWYPKLNPGGIICGDDYYWKHHATGSVARAIKRAAHNLNVNIGIENSFWYFEQKPN